MLALILLAAALVLLVAAFVLGAIAYRELLMRQDFLHDMLSGIDLRQANMRSDVLATLEQQNRSLDYDFEKAQKAAEEMNRFNEGVLQLFGYDGGVAPKKEESE